MAEVTPRLELRCYYKIITIRAYDFVIMPPFYERNLGGGTSDVRLRELEGLCLFPDGTLEGGAVGGEE